MKKLLYLLFALTLIACSKDEGSESPDSPINSNTKKVTKIYLLSGTDYEESNWEFSYRNNRIYSATSNGIYKFGSNEQQIGATSILYYIYTGNSIEFKSGTSSLFGNLNNSG